MTLATKPSDKHTRRNSISIMAHPIAGLLRNRPLASELYARFALRFARRRSNAPWSKEQIESRLGEHLHLVYAMTTTWESIGVLVYRGEVGIDLVDDFFGGPIFVSWHKLQQYFVDERRETGRETVGEWFQWLAERFAERGDGSPPVPAHVQHWNWRAR